MKVQAYLGIGSNLGNKEQNINTAVENIKLKVGEVLCASSFYYSKPWGFSSANNFVNIVLLVDTSLDAEQLLIEVKKIEQYMGRRKHNTEGYEDRNVDIDILAYGREIVDLPNLKIPHALMSKRDFVLVPFAEIAPNYVHPIFKKTVQELNQINIFKNGCQNEMLLPNGRFEKNPEFI